MANVMLYPKRGGAGGENKAEPWAFPENIANKLLKSGMWSSVPDVSNPAVATDLIAKAQGEVQKEKEKIAQERAELLAMKEEMEMLKAQLAEKKAGRTKSVEV